MRDKLHKIPNYAVLTKQITPAHPKRENRHKSELGVRAVFPGEAFVGVNLIKVEGKWQFSGGYAQQMKNRHSMLVRCPDEKRRNTFKLSEF